MFFETIKHEDEDQRTTDLTINPNFAYLVIPNLSVGLSILHKYFRDGDFGYNDERWGHNTFGIGPQIKYYVQRRKTAPFRVGGYSFSNQSYVLDDITLKLHYLYFEIGADFFCHKIYRNRGLSLFS